MRSWQVASVTLRSSYESPSARVAVVVVVPDAKASAKINVNVLAPVAVAAKNCI